MPGKLYGIGVGPGDPELMTLKAVRLIEECDIVAVPKSGDGEGVAQQIARRAVKDFEKKTDFRSVHADDEGCCCFGKKPLSCGRTGGILFKGRKIRCLFNIG